MIPESAVIEIVYKWPDGREEVRYRRPDNSKEAADLIWQVDTLRAQNGELSPYSWRSSTASDDK